MLHPDFGGGGAYGIPFMVVPANAEEGTDPLHRVRRRELDPGPFPIPPNAPVEGGASSDGDRHVLVVQQGTCHLYELYRAFWRGTRWDAASGVNWNLDVEQAAPARLDVGRRGRACRSSRASCATARSRPARSTTRSASPWRRRRRGYIFPATHYASSSTDPTLPPMGLRLRLKASYSLARFHGESLVILQALKRYGMIVADNGSSWFITGAADPRWNDDDLDQLKSVPGSAFEAVNTGPIHH